MSSQKLVLIVNSIPKEERVLSVSLRQAGIEVHVAKDGFEALLVLEKRAAEFGVVLIELNLEHMDGLELCERIRDEPNFDGLALIGITGSRDLATKLRAYEAGFDELLTKPVYVNELATRVELLLQRRAKELIAEENAEELKGSLGDVSIVDLLQTIEDLNKTGTTRLFGPDDQLGQLFFENGELLDAEVGRKTGEAALFRMMRWREGRYIIKYLPSLRRTRRIRRPIAELLADGMERTEHWSRLIDRAPDLTKIYEVNYPSLVDELPQMPEGVRALLRLFDGLRSLEQVVLDAPIGDLEILRVIDRFVKRGQITEVEYGPEFEEAALTANQDLNNWLDDEAFSPWTDELEKPSSVPELTREALLDEGERLDAESRKIQDEQAALLAAIAKSEAESARAAEDQARRDLESRRRDGAAPSWDGYDEEEEEKITDLLFNSLQSTGPALPSLDDRELARNKIIESHIERYEVVATSHVLMPMTLLDDDLAPEEPKADLIPEPTIDTSQLSSSGVFKLPIDEGLDLQALADEVESTLSQHKSQRQKARMRAKQKSRDPERITKPTLKPIEVAPHELDTPAEPIAAAPIGPAAKESPAPQLVALQHEAPTPVVTPAARAAAKESPDPKEKTPPISRGLKKVEEEPAQQPKVTAPELPLAKKANEVVQALSNAADTVSDEDEITAATVTASADSSDRLNRVSGTFDDTFFEDSVGPKASKLSLIFGVLLVLLIVGALVYLLTQGGEDPLDESPPVEATGTQKSDDPEPSPEPIEEPDEEVSPAVLDAQFKGSEVAQLLQDHLIDYGEYLTALPDEELPLAEHSLVGEDSLDAQPKTEPPAKDEKATPEPKKEEPKVVKKTEPEKEEKKPQPKIEKKESKADYTSEGIKLYKKGKYGDAIAKLEKAVAQNSGDAKANYYLGRAHVKQGNYAKALKYLEKVRSSYAKSASYWKELGSVYIRLKNEKQGIEAYKKAYELLDPNDSDAQKLKKYIDSRGG